MPSPARPTLRCLESDLTADWESVARQRVLLLAPDRLPRLTDLEHPFVRHMVSVFPGSSDHVVREGISGLTNPMWWKAKSGRWRGAVWEDDDGQAWLCAAGLRYEGEVKDFYKRFSADVTRLGADHFLLTQEDWKRLRYEMSVDAVAGWEQFHGDLVAEAFIAAGDGDPVTEIIRGILPGHPDLAEVEVTVVREEGIAEVVLTATPNDWSRVSQLDWAELVLLAAIDPQEQDWDASPAGKSRVYSIVVTSGRLDRLLEEAQISADWVCITPEVDRLLSILMPQDSRRERRYGRESAAARPFEWDSVCYRSVALTQPRRTSAESPLGISAGQRPVRSEPAEV